MHETMRATLVNLIVIQVYFGMFQTVERRKDQEIYVFVLDYHQKAGNRLETLYYLLLY